MTLKVTQDLLDKNTPADDDKFPVSDSADLESADPESGKLKRLSWANIKSALNSIYQVILAEGPFVDGDKTKLDNVPADTNAELAGKQETLVNQVNIKSVNGNTLLGSGDFTISAGAGGTPFNVYFTTIDSVTVPAYEQISYTAEASETVLTAIANNNEVLLQDYIFDGDVGVDTIQSGEWSFIFYGFINNTAQTSKFRFEVFARASGGAETTLFSVSSNDINNTLRERIELFTTQPSFAVNTTDRIGVKVYVNTTRTSNTTFSFVVGDGDASYFLTPLPARHPLLRERDAVNSHPGSAIELENIGGATYKSVQQMQDVFHSTGWVSGGTINDIGGSNITVDLGTGYIRANTTETSTLYPFDWGALTSTAIPSGTTRYIGIDYNAGSPIVSVRTAYDWNFQTNFPLGTVVNEGGTLHISNGKIEVGDHALKMIRRLLEVNGIQRDNKQGGLVIGNTGTRNITLSAGTLWQGLTEHPVNSIDTSVSGSFDYYLGNVLDTAGATQWDNNNYNNLGVKTVLTNNRWTNNWIYLETDGNLVFLYDTAEYTSLAGAQTNSAPSTIPNRIKEGGRIIAQITFQKGASTFTLRNFFDNPISSTAASDHNQLSNLQGGTAGEYYHLTSAEYTGTGTGNFVRANAPTFTGFPVTPSAAPTTDYQVANKKYVDDKKETFAIAASDETTALTTGTAKATFRIPYAFTVTEVRASLTGAGSTSGTTTIDINEGGTSILSTKLTIDFGEKTSTTAATPPVISDASLADDAEITIDIDAVTGGADETGLKIYIIGYQS